MAGQDWWFRWDTPHVHWCLQTCSMGVNMKGEVFCFMWSGRLLVGTVVMDEGCTVDVFVPETNQTYEIPVNERMSFRGCKLRDIGDLTD